MLIPKGLSVNGYPRTGDGSGCNGRRTPSGSDTIDYSVGFTDMARLGDQETVSVRWQLSTRKTKTAGRKGESGESGN